MLQQSLPGAFAYAGNFQQFGFTIAHLAAFAMERDGKTVRFVAYHLHQMKYWRVAVEDHGLVFLAVDVNDLFFLSDGRQRLVGDLQSFQSFGRGVKLAESTVDEYQAGERFLLIAQTLVAARDYFTHGSKVVHAFHSLHDELAVFRLVHLAVFPNHHRGHRLRALNVGNVETFNAFGNFRPTERVLN